MESVGIIIGQQADSYNNLDLSDVYSRFNNSPDVLRVSLAAGGQSFAPPTSAHIACVFDELSQPSHDPALLVIFANARGIDSPQLAGQQNLFSGNGRNSSQVTKRLQQPVFIAGDSDAPDNLLRRAAEAGRKRGAALDVFMLLASRPDIIHRHARTFPRGSVLAAIKTPGHIFPHQQMFGELLMSDDVRMKQPLDARNLLIDFLLSGHPCVGLPEIAMTGAARYSLKDMFRMMQPAGVSASARTELLAFRDLMPELQQDMVNRALNLSGPNNGLPNSVMKSPYACALLSVWDKLYGIHTNRQFDLVRPTLAAIAHRSNTGNTAGATVSASSANTSGNTSGNNSGSTQAVQQSTTGSVSHKTRPTSGELGQLPPKIRKLVQSDPKLARRLLR